MPKNPRIYSSEYPFHISARTNNKEFFKLNTSDVWKVSEDLLSNLTQTFKTDIHSFLLMENHFHAQFSFPEDNMSEAMLWFMTNSSKKINKLSGRINHLWGGRYHSQVIRDQRYFDICQKYIYRNPVKAKICKTVEEYPFSTLQYKLGQKIAPYRLASLNLKAEDLEWLNESFQNEHEELIQKGLRRNEFCFKKKYMTKQKIIGVLETLAKSR